MVLWTFVLAVFFREQYSTVENGRLKIGYFRHGRNAHIYKVTRGEDDQYVPLGRTLIGELSNSLTTEMSHVYLQLLNGKLRLYKEMPETLSSTLILITTEFNEADRGLTFSSIATQLVWETNGLDVVIFTGVD